MIAILRETLTNRYSVNALTAILDACDTPWVAAGAVRELVDRARLALARGRRVLVFYSFVTPDLAWVKDEIGVVATQVPEAALLAGGPHATADPEGLLTLGFHHVFVGEAEWTLPAFLDAGGAGPSVLADAEGGVPDLDRLPPFGRGRVGPVEITRGCPWGCGFCSVGRSRVRHRGRASVLEAAERLRATGRRKIFFITPNAFRYGGGLGDLDRLLGDLRTLGVLPVLGTFPSEVRPETVTREALQMLARHCHNRTLVVGAQSGSDAVLRRLGRGHTVEDVIRAARTARAFGFLPHVDLIFGLPGETQEERRATTELARRLRREAGAKFHAHYFHPLPGTPLWAEDPTPLDEETRTCLLELRRGGAEDGSWQEQEPMAWTILEWARWGWIRTPRRPAEKPGDRTK